MTQPVLNEALQKLNPATVELNLNGVVDFIERHGTQTRQSVAKHFGHSVGWSGDYLSEGVERGVLRHTVGRPILYNLANSETRRRSKDILRESGNSVTLPKLSVDDSVVDQLKALMLYYGEGTYSATLSNAIPDLVKRLQADGVDLLGLVEEVRRHEQALSHLRGQEKEDANALGDPSSN